MYGEVAIRLRSGRVIRGILHDFQTIPVPDRETGEPKVLVYAVVETVDGDFLARQLSEVKRDEKAFV